MNTLNAFIRLADQGNINAYTDYGTLRKNEFHSKGKAVLRRIAKELNLHTYKISSNLGGIAVSGEIILHSESLYICFSKGNSFLYRKCNGIKDFIGEQNNWMQWCELENFTKACTIFKSLIIKNYVKEYK